MKLAFKSYILKLSSIFYLVPKFAILEHTFTMMYVCNVSKSLLIDIITVSIKAKNELKRIQEKH